MPVVCQATPVSTNCILPPLDSTAASSSLSILSRVQSLPLTQILGLTDARKLVALYSSKTAIASTNRREPSIRRRSCNVYMGRFGPFKCLMEASLLTPTMSVSPSSLADRSSFTCPGWIKSKQPDAAIMALDSRAFRHASMSSLLSNTTIGERMQTSLGYRHELFQPPKNWSFGQFM